MFDAKRLLDQLVGSGAAGGFAGGLAGGVLANLLTGKKGRKLAGSALKIGGLALVGGLAYKAWQNYQQGQPQSAPDAGFVPPPGSPTEQNLSLLLARAMISAAKADGQIDSQESQQILNQINQLQVPAEDRAFLFEEYSKPLDLKALAGEVQGPEQAAEVYAASVLMLEQPSPPERIYLDALAAELKLAPALVTEIQSAVAASRESDAEFGH